MLRSLSVMERFGWCRKDGWNWRNRQWKGHTRAERGNDDADRPGGTSNDCSSRLIVNRGSQELLDEKCGARITGSARFSRPSGPPLRLRIVLVRLRIAKIHKDPVAHILGYKPIKPAYGLGDAFLVRRNDLAQVLTPSFSRS